MGGQDEFLALIDVIYEAAFDGALWPQALTRLADATGTAQVGLATMDRRANTYNSIAPRTDPVMDASYKNYWAFHDPVWPLVTQRPEGEVFSFDSIMSRRDFAATPVFNEWFRPAEFGLGIIGANLLAGDQVSALLCVANAPKNDYITGEQVRAFQAALPHIGRAVRIHRELRIRDLDHDTAPDRLEGLQRSVMLVDGAARVLFANAAARTLLGSGRGLACTAGRIRSTDGSATLQGLIASCVPRELAPKGPGGRTSIHHGRRGPGLRVTVTPLRAKGTVAELPWLGVGIPVAVVTVADSARERCLH